MTRVGTPLYLAPELVLNKEYSFEVDIWSVGCVLYLMAMQKVPFKAKNLITLGQMIVNKRHQNVQGYSKELSHFIDKCLHKSPSLRP